MPPDSAQKNEVKEDVGLRLFLFASGFALAYLGFALAANLLLLKHAGIANRTLSRTETLDALLLLTGFVVGIVVTASVWRLHRRRLARRRTASAPLRFDSAYLRQLTHELRTPLNAVLGFSELIRDQSLGGSEALPRYAEYAGHIHDSGVRLLAVANDLIDIADAARVD